MTITLTTVDRPDFGPLFECGCCYGSTELVLYVDCDHCDGTGEDPDTPDTECRDCFGERTVEQTEECDWCDGLGYDPAGLRAVEPTLGRLEDAFNSLLADGWQAMFGEWCCTSCSFAAAGTDETVPLIGFHEQDVQALGERGKGIHLFHHLPDVGAQVALTAALTDAGLTFRWDGDSKTRLFAEAVR